MCGPFFGRIIVSRESTAELQLLFTRFLFSFFFFNVSQLTIYVQLCKSCTFTTAGDCGSLSPQAWCWSKKGAGGRCISVCISLTFHPSGTKVLGMHCLVLRSNVWHFLRAGSLRQPTQSSFVKLLVQLQLRFSYFVWEPMDCVAVFSWGNLLALFDWSSSC